MKTATQADFQIHAAVLDPDPGGNLRLRHANATDIGMDLRGSAPQRITILGAHGEAHWYQRIFSCPAYALYARNANQIQIDF